MPLPSRTITWQQHLSIGVLASFCALLLATVGYFLGMFSSAEAAIGDWRATFATTPATGRTLIVGVDQETLTQCGGWPIDRSRMATVLNRLGAAGASRIYVDSSLSIETQAASDANLEAALKRLGPDRVALPVAMHLGHPNAAGRRETVEVLPLERFSRHTSIVSADFSFDGDGRVRTLGRTSLGEAAPQSNVAAWLATGQFAQPGISQVDFGIDLKTIPVLSFLNVEKNAFSASEVQGRNVLIGLVAERVTPPVYVPRYGEIQRPEFIALAGETLLRHIPYTPAPIWLAVVCAAIVVMILGNCLPRVGIVAGGCVTILSLVLSFAWSIELQRRTGLALPLGIPFAAILLTYAATLIATHSSFQHTRQALLSLVDKVDYGLARLFHSGVDAIITFSPEGKILTVNETAEKLFGVKSAAVVGMPLSSVLPDAAESLLRSASGHQPGRLVAKFSDEKGQHRHVDLAFNAVPSETGWVGYASIRDITDMKAREDDLQHQATHDAMTSLPNRAAFERHLEATLHFAAVTSRPFAIFVMDLNKFKLVNDTFGHPIGDALLIEVANRFKSTIRASDFVARLGGDEFAVVMAPPTDQCNAEEMAARLVRSVLELTEVAGHAIETGTSIGIAFYPEHAQTSDELMRMADQAMYVAKRGKHGYQVAAEALELAPC